jgi:hypothetical protein
VHKQCTVKLFCCEFDVRSSNARFYHLLMTSHQRATKAYFNCLNLFVHRIRMRERMVLVVVVVVVVVVVGCVVFIRKTGQTTERQ